MNREMLIGLVSEAALAPSVHNVQPARWGVEEEALVIYEDLERRLPACDPSGSDAAMSLGAAVEGVAIAATRQGLAIRCEHEDLPEGTSRLRPVARIGFETGAAEDPLSAFVATRQSWRGSFGPHSHTDEAALQSVSGEDCHVFTGTAPLKELANVVDTASFGFVRDPRFRRELLAWMRLSRRHGRWAKDGLNAKAMNLSAVEAAGAGLVLGPAFTLLDKLSLADKVLAETAKTQSAAGILLFHRSRAESPFDNGRAFYRLWLRIEAQGFAAAVIAALADDPEAAKWLAGEAGLSSEHRIVSAFRVGRRPDDGQYPRARRPLEELLV